MTRLFVYGTLKRGGRNVRLMADGHFVCEATTRPLYAIIDLVSHPGLVAGVLAVRGEVWEIPADTLRRLDAFEEVPYPFDRRPIVLADGTTAEAYFWLGPIAGVRSDGWGERPE